MKNSKKMIAMLATSTLVAAAVAPIASASSLSDIYNYTYKSEVQSLVDQGVLSGYDDNTFRPYKTLTRSDVVKILGKYLVSLGYKIPSDYKTTMRFSDLTRNSNDELLQYAAVVKDNGVFKGDNNRLLAGNKMTNEQAANVLVRAFSTIDDYDYVGYVSEQKFVREFLDEAVVSTETRQSMDIFDYYDIIKTDYFYPKFSIQRGEFAHMLYGVMQLKGHKDIQQLKVTSIIAVTPTRLTVTLSDLSTHNVYLDNPLAENVPTNVSFKISGTEYSGKATYYTKQLQITNVENINSGQFVLHFNQEVDLATTYKSSDLAKFMELTKVSTNTPVTFQKGELSDDRKSFKVTISSKAALEGTYNLKIKGIRALTGKSMADYEEIEYFATDNVKPYITNTKRLSKNLVKVTFNEPIYTTNSTITYKLPTGQTVTGVTAKYLDNSYDYYMNKTEIIFDLTNARQISLLKDFAKVQVSISNVRDIAGNYTASNPLTFDIQKGGPDGVAPKLQSVTQMGAKQFKLTFNEDMDELYNYQVLLDSNNQYYYVENVARVEGDAKSFIVTVDQYLDGAVTISSNAKHPVSDATGTTGTFSYKANFTYDTTKAYIERTYTIRENNISYLYVCFDRPVVVEEEASAILDGTYTYDGKKIAMTKAQPAKVYATEESNIVKIPVKELVQNYDREGAVYDATLGFTNVLNEYKDEVVNGAVQFERQSDYAYNTEKLKLESVETARTSKDITDNKLLVLNFNNPVDPTLAMDLFNYDLGTGYELESATVNASNPNQVLLKLKTTISSPVQPYLYVYNIRALNSMYDMEVYYEKVYLNEAVGPTYQSIELVNQKQIKVTFNEALGNVDSRAFYVANSSGQTLGAKASIDPTDSRKIVLTLEEALVPTSTISIRLTSGRTITDVYNNEGTFNAMTQYVPSSIPKVN